ncbi:RING-H2 zinc finger protein RHA1a-like [Pyrus ussuriensis x Pyrus communis]|uniref:RING-H2 zinc finger protein RHA1a-like n=1 Tax=Pyrus ussuriensis x Pyrus communis TaxID=2448454 RepID=A0A5N5HZG6_9ROSA|nr:RING-H2 zinc finger protein RHA1a-like [Pyrus ussuriensis x Pyrus communis]
MAFCVGIKMPKWFTTLLVLVHCFKILLMVALSYLGLLKPSQEMTELEEYRRRQTDNHFVLLDHLSPSAVPVPIHVLTEYIKRKLPVIKFDQVFEKYTRHESRETGCSICLECIERSHEVREPWNCDHLFHRECLDSWVNQGQVTCPLCRSLLFPAKSEITSYGGGSSGTTERDEAYFSRFL